MSEFLVDAVASSRAQDTARALTRLLAVGACAAIAWHILGQLSRRLERLCCGEASLEDLEHKAMGTSGMALSIVPETPEELLVE